MKKERGFTLIEVIIALALLGIIAVAFLGSLAVASKAIFIADERATAESLARTQMEDVKNQDYIDYSVDSNDPHDIYAEITPPPGYSIDLTAVPFDPDTGQPYGYTVVEGILVFDQDDGIQMITVTVSHHDKPEVITLEDYKVNR